MKMDQQGFNPLENTAAVHADLASQGAAVGASCHESVMERECMDASAVIETQKTETMPSALIRLQGLVYICSYCKKIRDEEGVWNKIDWYVYDPSETEFSHLICPDCYERAAEDFKLQ